MKYLILFFICFVNIVKAQKVETYIESSTKGFRIVDVAIFENGLETVTKSIYFKTEGEAILKNKETFNSYSENIKFLELDVIRMNDELKEKVKEVKSLKDLYDLKTKIKVKKLK